MTKLPPITVVVTTYLPDGHAGAMRAIAVNRTLESWLNYLRYNGELCLHIADDGSNEPLIRLNEWIHREVTYSRQNRKGVGASLNAGFRRAFETSPLVAYFVDDWALTRTFDLTPWAQLLMEREDVGMVRLGPPHPGIAGRVEMFTDNWQGWGLRLWRQGFAFAHRPALYHKRMIDRYGWFAENVNALECEHRYNMVFCSIPDSITMPDIVLALPHPWQHLDTPSLSALEPEQEK